MLSEELVRNWLKARFFGLEKSRTDGSYTITDPRAGEIEAGPGLSLAQVELWCRAVVLNEVLARAARQRKRQS